MRLFIATPCYGGQLCVNYASSAIPLMALSQRDGVEIGFHFLSGESLIPRARNDLAARFLASDATHLMFIDADIGFDPKSVLRLVRSGFPVVAGAYPLKCDELRFPLDYDAMGPVDANGFASVAMATTGFLCIERSVFARIMLSHPELRYETDNGESRFAFFNARISEGRYLSEDYSFCLLWYGSGGAIHLDTTCALTHQGRKVYSGDLTAQIEMKRKSA